MFQGPAILVAVLLWLATVTGQGPVLAGTPEVTIRGQVINDAGVALPGVHLLATDVSINESVTDETGHYKLSQLAEGSYLVTVELPGFETVSLEITVKAGMNGSVDFKLTLRTSRPFGISSLMPLPSAVKRTFNDRLTLQIWLNSDEAQTLMSVIPLGSKTSLFVSAPKTARSSVRVVIVRSIFNAESLSACLDRLPGRIFLGVHILDDMSYLVFLS